MLISKSNKIEVGDLATFKLVNGDEIVGKITEHDRDGWTIENPMTVVPSQKGVALFPSLITAVEKPTVTLIRQHILMMSLTTKELESHYTQLTTGIVTAPQGIIA